MNRRSEEQNCKISPARNFWSFIKNILRFGLMFAIVIGGYMLIADFNHRNDNAVVYQQDISELPNFDTAPEISMMSELPSDYDTEENIIVIDSAKLDVDLIEQKLKQTTAEVAKHAEASVVEVYSNADGILIKPRDDFATSSHQTGSTISPEGASKTKLPPAYAALDTMDSAAIEATYEEELPEGEYQEVIEPQPKGYHVYHGHKKLRDMEIDISHKPPYFGSEPVIAIVIDDMGISHARTRDISSLQGPITSSFLTYGTKLEAQIDVARAAGHEIIAHVPMQPKSNLDIAPDVLTVQMSPSEIKQNFEHMLSKFSDIKGVNNHMGSLFTEQADKLAPVMEVLAQRGLYFLDSKTSSHSVGRQVASQYQVAYAHRHVFLDNVNEVEYVNRQLELTERIARRNGYAVAIGHPKSATYQALKVWLPSLEKKHIKLWPLSEVVKVLNPQFMQKTSQPQNNQDNSVPMELDKKTTSQKQEAV